MSTETIDSAPAAVAPKRRGRPPKSRPADPAAQAKGSAGSPDRSPSPVPTATGTAASTTAPAAVAKSTKPKTPPARPAGPSRKDYQRAADQFKHLGDATRLQVVAMLADGELNVGGMCERLALAQPAVSHHLSLLRHGGVIQPRRSGKRVLYALTGKGETLAAAARSMVGV